MSYTAPNGFIPYPNDPDLYYAEQIVYDQNGTQFREITYFSISTGQTQVSHYPVENTQAQQQFQVQDNSTAVKTPPKKSKTGLIVSLFILTLLIAGGLIVWLTGAYKMLPFFGTVSGTAYEENNDFAMGYSHSVFLQDDGTVVATGGNNFGQCNVDTWADIVAVYANGNQTLGLKSDGTVVATGDNEFGQCNVEAWTDVVDIVANYFSTTAVKVDGTVITTSEESEYDRTYVYTNLWSDVSSIGLTGGMSGIICGYKHDGTILIAREFTQTDLDLIKTFTDIKKLTAFSIPDDQGDYIDYYIYGKNNGQFFIETNTLPQYLPIQVNDIAEKIDLDNIADITIPNYTYVLYKDGTVAVFDTFNDFEKVDDLDTDDWTDITAIKFNFNSLIGLRSDGTFVSTGINDYGELDLESIGIPVYDESIPTEE